MLFNLKFPQEEISLFTEILSHSLFLVIKLNLNFSCKSIYGIFPMRYFFPITFSDFSLESIECLDLLAERL